MTSINVTTEDFEKVGAGQATLASVCGIDKDPLEAIAVLGYQLYEQGKRDEAATFFDGLIALDDKLYYGYAGLGAIALAEDKLDEASLYLTHAHSLNPNDPTVCANLGEVLLRQGKFGESAAMLQKALELDPDRRDPGANRACAILQGIEVVLRELEANKA